MEGTDCCIAMQDGMPKLMSHDDSLNVIRQVTVDGNNLAARIDKEKALTGLIVSTSKRIFIARQIS